MLKKALIPAVILVAASVAVPSMASAQQYRGDRGDRYEQSYRGWQPIAQRKVNLDRRIDIGARNGQLSRREATRLRTELNQLVRLEYTYQRGGLTVRERAELDRRYDRLSAQVREERRDRDNRRY
jgi:hypothetical protein